MREISFINAMQLIKDGYSVSVEYKGELSEVDITTGIDELGYEVTFMELIGSKWYIK